MAKQYKVNSEFVPIDEQKGTLYNTGSTDAEVVSETNPTKGEGLVLRSGLAVPFASGVLVRSMDDDDPAIINVVDFKVSGEGGAAENTTATGVKKYGSNMAYKKNDLLTYGTTLYLVVNDYTSDTVKNDTAAGNIVAIDAASAAKLSAPVKIGGVSFDGSEDIDLPGVNKDGTQDTSGNAATATALKTARKINGVEFDGSQDITIYAEDKNTPRIKESDKGAKNGVAELDESGQIPSSQLPSYVDDVLEYADKASLPAKGETGKIYVTLDNEYIYRWSGTEYIRVNSAVSTAEEATKLSTVRKIGGVEFDGTKDIDLPGVNTEGNQNTSGKATTAGTADTAKACSGNAATATKLATARSVSLSGDASGAATFDGTANIIIPVTFTREAGLTNLIPDGAAAHNAIYRGKDLTADFNSGKVSTNIANGTFKDIFVGDYIDKTMTVNGNSIGTVRWRVADLDGYLYKGDTAVTAHHAVMVPDDVLDVNIRMNDTNTSVGGYVATEMYKTTLSLYAAGIQSAFGSDHVLSHRCLLTNSISADAPSAGGKGMTGSSDNWSWYTSTAQLMSEVQVFGSTAFSSSSMDVGEADSQFALFRLHADTRIAGYRGTKNGSTRKWWWLRAVVSSSCFASAAYFGYPNYYDASARLATGGIRPYFLLR